MTRRKYTRAEVDRAQEIMDGVHMALALAGQTDWGGDLQREPWDLCRLVARIERLSRRYARQLTNRCNIPATDESEAALEKTRGQLEKLAAEFQAFGPEFEFGFTTGVSMPVELKVNDRQLKHRGVYNGR